METNISRYNQLPLEAKMTHHCHSVAKPCPTLRPHRLQHTKLPCPSLCPRVCLDSCPLSWWCRPTISSSVAPFSSCPQSPNIRVLSNVSARQSIRVSTSPSVLPMKGWFPLGLTGLNSLLSKGLLRVFSSNIILKHQFFGTQLSLWSNSHIRMWLLEKP